MRIAIRGEGPADMGGLYYANSFKKGPMVILIEKLDCYKQVSAKEDIEWVYIHRKDTIQSSKDRKKGIKEVQIT